MPAKPNADTTMRRHFAWARRLLIVGLVLFLLGSVSMAVGLILLAFSFEVAAGAFLGYLIVSSALVVGGGIAIVVALVLE
jgi:hypothetical protein